MVVIMIVLGTASSMGYGLLDFIRIFGMNFLDFFDFMTNSVMMPLAALATCILILRVVGIDGMVKKLNSLLRSAERNCTEYLSNILHRFA